MQVSYPGVYVREVPSGVRTITGVPTSITVFIGMTARGRLLSPQRVLSYPEFRRSYSDDASQSELSTQVRQFFLNGGSDAYILRVAHGASAAEVVLQDVFASSAVVTLRARDAGSVGNIIKARVSYDSARPDDTFSLTLWREVFDATGTPRAEQVERHGNLSMDPDDARFVTTVLEANSRLLVAEVSAAAANAQKGRSASAQLFADDGTTSATEAAKDAINAAIAAKGGTGSLRIRVGTGAAPGAAVLVSFNGPLTTFSDFAATIQSALPSGTTITATVAAATASDPAAPIVLTAGANGEGVIVTAGGVNDISHALGFGVDAGGVEVGAYAHVRPRPNGIVVPGFSTAAAPTTFDPIGAMVALADLTRPADVEVTGPTLPLSPPASLSFEGSGATLGVIASGDTPSLSALRTQLTALATTVNGTAAGWRGELHQNRVVFFPLEGTAQAGFGHTLVLDPTTSPTSFAADVAAYSVGTSPSLSGSAQSGHLAGDDGTPPGPAEYQQAFEVIDREVDLFNLLVLPRSTAAPNGRDGVWAAASSFCQSRRAFLIVDPPLSWTDRDKASAGITALRTGLVKDHCATYWPRVLLSADGATVDASGSVAGVMARTDARIGVWKAPAGLEATLRAVRGVSVPMSNRDNGVLNPLAINALRAFPNGIVSWGSRTMDGFDGSGNNDYNHVPLRRLALFLAESLDRGLRFAVFQGNDERLWGQIRMAASSFLNGLFRQGAFAGTDAQSSYFVKCDRETTTQNDINLGIVNVLVGFAPLKPAEFIVIHLQQMAGQILT